MSKNWIDDLDDLAGLDMIAARDNHRAEAKSDAAALRSRNRRPPASWHWLTRIWSSQKQAVDLRTPDARCRTGSRRV